LVLYETGVGIKRLAQIGKTLARSLRSGDLVLLYGPLGAGKTTLVRSVAKTLQVTDPVRSPSFTIANIYSGSTTVQHLDLYRLDEIGEDDALALEEYVGVDAITLVEWPEAGLARLGQPAWIVRMDHESLHLRSIEIEAADDATAARWRQAEKRPEAPRLGGMTPAEGCGE
jgi:tRNA threonylcarbamoyladenosine biosynthesis protein TsaE